MTQLLLPRYLVYRLRRSSFRCIASVGVLDNQRNPPVRWIKRILRVAQKLIGKPPDLRNLRPSQTLLLHQSSRGIGAVRRELPIPIIPLPAIRLRIGMALYRNFVRQFAEFAREQIQQFFTILIWSGATEIEKSAGCRFQKLDPQSF